jgi:hypothetical protein
MFIIVSFLFCSLIHQASTVLIKKPTAELLTVLGVTQDTAYAQKNSHLT